MRQHITRLALLTALLAALLTACGTGPSATAPAEATATPGSMAGMDHGGHGTGSAATPDGMVGMDHGGAPYDAQFIDGMTVHHQGATAMARQVLQEPAARAELKTMAEDIITAQEAEIAQMAQWRKEWYPDLAPTAGANIDMGDMQISDDASIPFDQRFITAMISHHQGAIAMARDAQAKAEHAEIKALAQDIITAQEAEIAQMQRWQQEWYR